MLRAIDFHGLKGVEFSKGEYTVLLIPEMGANLVRLANTRLGAEILRTPGPGEIETFRSRPQVFGLPILFPPNRIADGRYVFEGRTYQYPITIERERNYHHGVLKSEAFLVSKARETDREVMIECRYYANAGNDAVYRDFPHEFKCKITYRLSAEGLEQEVMFGNKSDLPMPVGVGFHTPLNVPFAGGDAADYRLRMAVGERFELNGRNLPTGWLLPLDERFARLRAPEGLQATGCEAIEAGFSVREIEAMAVGLRETLDETMISQSPSFIKYLVESLDKLGIPVVTPPGVLGAHVDAMAFCPHIPQTEYPAGALAAAFYLISGIRGMERGTISSVRDENGDEILADVELLRLAVPRRVFTLSQVKYVIDRLAWLYENRDMIGGLKFVYEPPVLRFFMGGLEPTSDWPEKLMIKFRKDFGESL